MPMELLDTGAIGLVGILIAAAILLRGRIACWLAGHRVGPARVHRADHDQHDWWTSRCQRCGASFSGISPRPW